MIRSNAMLPLLAVGLLSGLVLAGGSDEISKQASDELNSLNQEALEQIDPARHEGQTLQIKAKVLPRGGRPGARTVEIESVKELKPSKKVPGASPEQASAVKGPLDDELAPKSADAAQAVKVKAMNDELSAKEPGASK